MPSADILSKMEQRAVMAEHMIDVLTKQINHLLEATVESQKTELQKENKELKAEVDRLKNCLVKSESEQGVKQYFDFTKKLEPETSNNVISVSSLPIKSLSEEPPSSKAKEKNIKNEKKEKDTVIVKAGGGPGKKADEELPIDVGRLDFRVGRIVVAKKHPDADSLYVEEVDVGEVKMRTVVSGLVKFVPEAEMQNRMAVLLCNLKPAKMRGITSEAMVMCASTPEKVEILTPPEGSIPGDLIEFEGIIRNPDPVLNPKKKVFETCAPDLKTNSNRVATYKNIAFKVSGKGNVTASTLFDVNIK